jgi:hypothetical protein
VIAEVDKALRLLVGGSAGAPEGLQVVFEPPNAKWVETLDGTPTINFHLYDIQGDAKGIQVGLTKVRNERNQVIGYRIPATWYRLSYVGTAWSASRDPEEDHELLGWLLYVLAGLKAMPGNTLTGSLARVGVAGLEICRPTVDARPTPHSVAALGGMARPYLEVVVTAPVVQEVEEAAGLVLEELVVEAQGFNGQPFERVQRRFSGGIAELEETDPGDPFVEKSRGSGEDG